MTFQANILTFLEGIRTEPLTLLFTSITIMAESVFLAVIVALLYWCIDKKKSKRLAWLLLFNSVCTGVIKNIVKMPRPFELGAVKPIRVETATSYSFPSGHTGAATSFWLGSMLVLKTKGAYWLGSIMILLTAISRLYLGVHWPMDVLGAIVFGIIFTKVADALLDETATFKKWHVIGTSIVCLITLIFNVDRDLYKMGAALWAGVLGLYLEQQYINFVPQQSFQVQIKKLVLGIVVLVILYVGMSKLLPDVKIMVMLKYTLVLLWITAGAPYCFDKLKNKMLK